MGIMLVYDITNEKSFENIVKWLRNIDEHANEDVERMILGNKCDMTDKRIVSKERGEGVSILICDKNFELHLNKLTLTCACIFLRLPANMELDSWKHPPKLISI